MINFEYFCLPALYVKDISSDVIHMVGEYAVVRFDNASGDRLEFIDREKDRFDYYKRGKFCDIWLKITDTAKYTDFTIIAMKYMKDED